LGGVKSRAGARLLCRIIEVPTLQINNKGAFMGIRDIIAIGKLMWNLVRNAKEFAALKEETPRLKADLAACRAEREKLVAAHQTEITRLQDENAALIENRPDWTGYEPYSPIPGVTVYRYVPPDGSAAAEHLACPNCRDTYGKKSILQSGVISGKPNCPACGTYYGFRMK